MIKIREKDALFIGINLILFLFDLVYIILYWLSDMALQMSEALVPQETSGIFVLMTFAKMIFAMAIVIVIIVDIWWIGREIKKWQKNYRRENL